jgi:hypothetical protein
MLNRDVVGEDVTTVMAIPRTYVRRPRIFPLRQIVQMAQTSKDLMALDHLTLQAAIMQIDLGLVPPRASVTILRPRRTGQTYALFLERSRCTLLRESLQQRRIAALRGKYVQHHKHKQRKCP